MAKLFFYYSTMNAGKSTNLLQASYNYKERGFNTILFNYHADNRDADGNLTNKELFVTSRLGIRERAYPFNNETNMIQAVQNIAAQDLPLKDQSGNNLPIGAILIDEAQFLTAEQVKQLSDIVDYQNIPVLCYGIRTDFLGEPFTGSVWLLAWADEIVELKTICATGKKATFVLRLDENGKPQNSGEKVQIGGNNVYVAVSRKLHKQALKTGELGCAAYHTVEVE
ncbi:thymidine kinase [Psittacicella melopsittaci]|uniref:Thymidine kinase n=1 Tax=Psittacicella melopsittaci TaxID=2028576 RepID=A0A3A1Y1V2_9GAMM|nr:thymidine kinase [Psittacicella melopsittaci]RIY31266.1 thymidine kinase [Psittacicella melopsittaci]